LAWPRPEDERGDGIPTGARFFSADSVINSAPPAPHGNIQGGYIFNFPVSQWAGLAHFNITKEVQISAGVYDANPNYLTTSDAGIYAAPGIPRSSPASGVLVPVELTWRPGGHLYGT
jgi:porin